MPQRRFLITAALPYSNGRLHVGHIAGAYLPADIYVRYLRARGEQVRFICGSDDNGVAALISARNEGLSVEECTAKYNARQKADFASLNIDFDIYGGTHQPGFAQTHEKLSQQFFSTIHDEGYFTKKSTDQLYDPVAKQFLPDRYVQGTCPECGFDKAYGDQCDNCGKSMDPLKLKNPKSTVTKDVTPEVRTTTHWYLRLKKFEPELKAWLDSHRSHWRQTVINFAMGQLFNFVHANVPGGNEQLFSIEAALKEHGISDGEQHALWVTGTKVAHWTVLSDSDQTKLLNALKALGIDAWPAGGLPERAMTRDLTWGVPVPLDDPNAQGKVLYVWFDAPIGYVTFTAAALDKAGLSPADYGQWWKNPDCKIVNFIGEDNIVFHAIIWPAMLMAANVGLKRKNEPEWQLAHNVVANSFLNMKYEDGKVDKISKSRTPADAPVWIEEYVKTFEPDPLRYYLTAVAPESARTAFDMNDYNTQNNSVLVAVLGNFINRWITFAPKYFDGVVPAVGVRGPLETDLLDACRKAAEDVTKKLEACQFKAAQEAAMDLARAGNKYFDMSAPFKTRKTDLAVAGTSINVCIQVGKMLAALFGPFLPTSARKIAAQLNIDPLSALDWPIDSAGVYRFTELPAGHRLGEPQILFKKFEPAAK